jgi:hypothetical protein
MATVKEIVEAIKKLPREKQAEVWRRLDSHLAADVNAVSKANLTPWLAASGLGDRFGGVLFNTETAALLEKLGADPKLGKPCQAQGKCR